MPKFNLDFHVHFSFKPANSAPFKQSIIPDPDHWRMRYRAKKDWSEFASIFGKAVVKSSQSHADGVTKGGYRVLVNALYPLERGFIKSIVLKSIGALTGHDKEALRRLKKGDISYFQVLEREYNNLLNNANDSTFSKLGNTYVLVNSYQDLKSNLLADNESIQIINSIEGTHAFADDLFDNNNELKSVLKMETAHFRELKQGNAAGDPDFKAYLSRMFDNVNHMKTTWQFVPFFITFSHHYFNFLAGHAKSLSGFTSAIAVQSGTSKDNNLDTCDYFYLGFQPWGRAMLNLLLSRMSNGNPVRRVLIDVKHMSVQARIEYYAMLKQNPADHIPIIKSHTAVSGRTSMQRTIDNEFVLMNDEKGKSKYFCQEAINLFDDEIQIIADSDGIIGLMIDETRIIGKVLPPESGYSSKGPFNEWTKKSKKALSEIVCFEHEITWILAEANGNPLSPVQQAKIAEWNAKRTLEKINYDAAIVNLKDVYLSVILRQCFYIVDIVGEKGWDMITIGTDFDGVINPIDIYPFAEDMANIEDDLNDFWDRVIRFGLTEHSNFYSSFLFGKSRSHWVKKILYLNGINFFKKYFNDAYLLQGQAVQKGWVLTDSEINQFLAGEAGGP